MEPNVKTRPKQNKTRTTLFRVPESLADQAYSAFYTLAHRQKLAESTPAWAHRLIRLEHLSRQDLIELRDLINVEGPQSISGRCVGGQMTLDWIASVI
jgi:hypothetical protein